MGTILFLLLFVLVLMPLWRIAVAYYRARRQFRDLFGGADTRRTARDPFRGAFYGSDAPERPVAKKKIDPSVGEYVAFEEISTERTTVDADGNTTIEFRREQQIVDVEWEDLPRK